MTEHIRKEAEKILLDLKMPNGKQLRACTGQEVEQFGKEDEHRGRWLRRLAAKIQPHELVGVLSEQDVREEYDAAA